MGCRRFIQRRMEDHAARAGRRRPGWARPSLVRCLPPREVDSRGTSIGGMAREESVAWNSSDRDGGRFRAGRPAMGDQALVAALRCEDEGALREFYLRFRPTLLLAARRLGVDPGHCDTVVDDCLADVAVHLIASGAAPPRSLPAYLARSLRNRVLNAAPGRRPCRTTAGRRARRCGRRPRPRGGLLGARAPLERGFAHRRRALAGAAGDWQAPSRPSPRAEEERLLAVWLSHCVPQQAIAEWLGIGRPAAAKRIERLRARLQLAALKYVEALKGDERQELLDLSGRASLAPGPAARLAAVRGAMEGPVP